MTAPTLDRTDALATLGVDVTGSGTAQQALIDAGIAGMDVRKVPVISARSGNRIPHRYCLEDASGETLPNMIVGEDFTVVQYDDVAATLDAVAARTGATFDRCGQLDVRSYGIGGARAFVSMRLPNQLHIGDDLVDGYVVAFMSHGWNSNVLAPTATRVDCANQQPQIAREEKFKIIIRHTSSAPARHLAAEKALVTSVESMKRATLEAEQMLAVKTTNDQFRAIVDRVYPVGGESKAAITRSGNRLEQLEMIRTGPTNAAIAGTAWGDYQAILEYGEWYQRVKGGDDEDTNLAAVRARRALTAPGLVKTQLNAYQTVRQLVGIN